MSTDCEEQVDDHPRRGHRLTNRSLFHDRPFWTYQQPEKMQLIHLVILIASFMRISSAQENISDDYLQRVEKVRQFINKAKSPTKTKKYKCIEVNDGETLRDFPQDDNVISAVKPRASRNRRPSYERPKLRQVSLTSRLRPSKENSFHPVEKLVQPDEKQIIQTVIDAPPAVYATGFPQARAMPSRKMQSKVIPQDTVHRNTAVVASTSKPPLILSPEHCAQVKYYADLYGVKDVLSWVKGNCAFAKMYLPDATCEEINILVASCNREKYRSI